MSSLPPIAPQTDPPPACPMHRMLRHLKRFATLPVPYVVQWVGDRPDFRVIDPYRSQLCVAEKLCAVCAEKLGSVCWWIGGPLTFEHRMFSDSAMHEVCARESMRLCPFLSGRTVSHRHGNYTTPVAANPYIKEGRPEWMYLMKGKSRKMRFMVAHGSPVISSGPLLLVERFRALDQPVPPDPPTILSDRTKEDKDA